MKLRNAVAALCAGWCASALAVSAPLPASEEALAAAMQRSPVVLLGEVHDNASQHALRAAALRLLVERGARPAIAFEQFDRERQDAIDRARRERPRDVDYLIAQAQGAPSWRWELYRPFIALALEYDLPIVAANLSRAAAMKVATSAAPGDALPAEFLRVHEEAIAKGHCNLLPPEALPGMARAQIARDRTLAEAIAPYAGRGVVLLTGNGHVRTDVGVPYWLPPAVRAKTVSIGLLERGDAGEPSGAFDALVLTEAAARPNPCEELRKRMKPRS